jgi:flagellar motor switch protein FliN/FliY
MPDSHSGQTETNFRRWLLDQLQLGLSRSIEAMTGEPVNLELADSSDTPPVPHRILWFRQPFQPFPNTESWVGAEPDSHSAIGAQVLRAAGIEEFSPDDAKGSYLETLQQALSSLAQSLTALLGREVLCQGGAESQEIPPGPFHAYRIQLDGGSPIYIYTCFGDGFLHSIMSLQGADLNHGASMPEHSTAGASGDDEKDTNRTLDLFYDVELPIAVSFGRAQLPLREVIKLTSGSIVELNRAVSEPVEIIVNNCVIARGEVVVVEGNYGVRVSQIVSRRERLRTLR